MFCSVHSARIGQASTRSGSAKRAPSSRNWGSSSSRSTIRKAIMTSLISWTPRARRRCWPFRVVRDPRVGADPIHAGFRRQELRGGDEAGDNGLIPIDLSGREAEPRPADQAGRVRASATRCDIGKEHGRSSVVLAPAARTVGEEEPRTPFATTQVSEASTRGPPCRAIARWPDRSQSS
jgi:hypothetical protein